MTPLARADVDLERRAATFDISDARRWIVVGLLTLAAIISYADRAALSVALPAISLDLHLGPVAKGVVLSSFFWLYTLLQIPVGVLTDRVNLRWFFAACFALWSVASGLTGLAESMAVLIAMRILLGVGESILQPATLRAVAGLFVSKERGLPTGLCATGTRFGLALGAPLSAWLVVRYGWHRMFFLVGFLALAWLVPWLMACPRQIPQDAEVPRIQGSRQFLAINKNLIGCCLGSFCFGYYQYILVTWLPDYFVSVRHFSLMNAGIYAAITYLVWGVCGTMGGWIADKFIQRGRNETITRKTVITVSFATSLLIIPAALTGSAMLAASLATAASLVGLCSGNALVVVQDCAPRGQVGAWSGMSNFVGNLGGVLSPLVTGSLIATTGSYVYGFVLGALVLVAGILPYWFMVGDLTPLEA